MQKNFQLLTVFLLLIFEGCSSGTDTVYNPNNTFKTQVNYGDNVIVLTDLSNRIENNRLLSDPQIITDITHNLKALFQRSIDKGINDKFYLTSINDQDLKDYSIPDSVFKIDLTKFKNNANSRADYLYHNDTGANSLKHGIDLLNYKFSYLYTNLKKEKQLPADIWYYFQTKLDFPLIDTTTTQYDNDGIHYINSYNNYIILLTDGYIEAGRYGDHADMKFKNKYRYLSQNTINNFRDDFKRDSISDLKAFFEKFNYGIIPVQNPILKKCKILVLEMYDRSVINGVTTKNPTDFEIMKLFWQDWLEKSQVKKSNIILKECFNNTQNLDEELKTFFDLK